MSISDPASGFLTVVRDLSTGQTGYMQASASNGFADTNIADCSGNPHTWHAEYNTAEQQNQVPWAALEGGVLMEQEIGHFESCNSLSNQDPYTASYLDGTTYSDPQVYQTCDGGLEGRNAIGEGPCSPDGTVCQNASTQGPSGPTACPTGDATSGALCEFADGYCFPQGSRMTSINGKPVVQYARIAGCFADQFQNKSEPRRQPLPTQRVAQRHQPDSDGDELRRAIHRRKCVSTGAVRERHRRIVVPVQRRDRGGLHDAADRRALLSVLDAQQPARARFAVLRGT